MYIQAVTHAVIARVYGQPTRASAANEAVAVSIRGSDGLPHSSASRYNPSYARPCGHQHRRAGEQHMPHHEQIRVHETCICTSLKRDADILTES